MIYTSNYFNYNDFADCVKISISVSLPKGLPYVPEIWRTVAPDWLTILKPYKSGLIDDDEYTRRYLRKLNDNKEQIIEEFRRVLSRNADVVLLCWCKKGDFCHRRLLAGWLQEQGFGVIDEL